MVGGFTPFERNVNIENQSRLRLQKEDEFIGSGLHKQRGNGNGGDENQRNGNKNYYDKILNPLQIIETIMTGKLQLPRNMSSLGKDLIRNILCVDPNMRLEIADIKQHKYFRGIKWDLIAQ